MSEGKGNKIYDKLTPQRKQLVDEILKNLESGTGLWRQGWQVTGAPVSAITGKRYNGVNRLFLTAAMMQKGYSDNRWLTYNQMEEKGWHFKKTCLSNGLLVSLSRNSKYSIATPAPLPRLFSHNVPSFARTL